MANLISSIPPFLSGHYSHSSIRVTFLYWFIVFNGTYIRSLFWSNQKGYLILYCSYYWCVEQYIEKTDECNSIENYYVTVYISQIDDLKAEPGEEKRKREIAEEERRRAKDKETIHNNSAFHHTKPPYPPLHSHNTESAEGITIIRQRLSLSQISALHHHPFLLLPSFLPFATHIFLPSV